MDNFQLPQSVLDQRFRRQWTPRKPSNEQSNKHQMTRSVRKHRAFVNKKVHSKDAKNDREKVYKKRSRNRWPVEVFDLSKDIEGMIENLGEIQVLQVFSIISEAHVRETKGLVVQDPLIERIFELRGEDHSSCDIGERNARYYFDKGYEFRCKGDFQNGTKMLLKSVTQDNQMFNSWFNLGYMYYHVGDYIKAKGAYIGACKLKPDLPFVHFNLGICCTKLGHYQQAVNVLNRAIALDSTRCEFYRARAYAHRKRCSKKGNDVYDGDFVSASRDLLCARTLEEKRGGCEEVICDQETLLETFDSAHKCTRTVSYPSIYPCYFDSSDLWEECDEIQLNVQPTVDDVEKNLLDATKTVYSRGQLTFGRYLTAAAVAPEDRSPADLSALKTFVRGIKCCQCLNELLVEKVCKEATLSEFIEGEVLVQQGRVVTSLYLILQGKVDCFKDAFRQNKTAVYEEQEDHALAFGMRAGSLWPGEAIGAIAKANKSKLTYISGSPKLLVLKVDLEKLVEAREGHRNEQLHKTLRTLRHLSLFHSMEDDVLRKLGSSLVETNYNAAEVVLGQGDRVKGVYIIARGSCEVIHTLGSGERMRVCELGVKDYFGDNCLKSTLFQETGERNKSKATTQYHISSVSIVCQTSTKILLLGISDIFAKTTFHVREKIRTDMENASQGGDKSAEQIREKMAWQQYKTRLVESIKEHQKKCKTSKDVF